MRITSVRISGVLLYIVCVIVFIVQLCYEEMSHMWKVTTRNASLRQQQFKTSMAAVRSGKIIRKLDRLFFICYATFRKRLKVI